MKKIFGLCMGAACIIFGLSDALAEEIKIGAVVHLTGDQASQGRALLEGIELAVDEYNKNNSCGGRAIKLLVEDSQLKPRGANQAAKRLIHIKKIDAALNSSYLESMANGKEFEAAKIPVVTLWDSAPQIDDIGDYVFAIGIWSPSAGEAAAGFAYDKLQGRTAAVVSTENEWSITVSESFKKKFKSLGGIVSSHNAIPTTASDFRTVLTKIISSKPDVLYSPVTDNVVAFYSQLRELGFKGKIISSDIITNEHIKAAPNVFSRIYQTQATDPENHEAVKLKQLYVNKFQKQPDQLSLTVLGYDGITVLCQAFGAANGDPKKIKDQVYNIKHLTGASGTISINPAGSSRIMESIFEIENGAIKKVY